MFIKWLANIFGAPKVTGIEIDITELPRKVCAEPQSIEDRYQDALNHIMKICDQSSTRTKRIKWIEHRAKCALNGGNWREVAYPRNRSHTRVDSMGGEI